MERVFTDYKCDALSKKTVGVVYFFNPTTRFEEFAELRKKNGSVFKLHHFYSLISLVKLFGATKNNRVLFYYLKDFGKPVANQFNRWLEDLDWQRRLGFSNIKFVGLEYQAEHLDLFKVFAKIRNDCVRHFDNFHTKKYILYTTSDVIPGLGLLNCFAKNTQPLIQSSWSSSESMRQELTSKCWKYLIETKFFSYLFKINKIHQKNDFSGILLERLDESEFSVDEEEKFADELAKVHVSEMNNYKCHYRRDVFHSAENAPNSFKNTHCVFGFDLNLHDTPYLQEIFFYSDYFSRFMRHSLYGLQNPVSYRMVDQEPIIPNVVHLIFFSNNKRELKFVEYLCLKSILLVLRPDKVKVHGDQEPQGQYWLELTQSTKILWVQRERNYFKYGQNFSNSPIQHLADIARLEILYEEGGIYSDFDILWVKNIEPLRKYDVEVIAANDLTSYCSEFPNNIQIGAFLAAPKSEFVRKWLDGYRDKYHLFPGDYAAISMCEPYKIYEKHPEKVLIENRLQMIFFNGWSLFIPR